MKKFFNSKAKIILISGISILLIVVFTGFIYIKNTLSNDSNIDQTTVKLNIPEINDKQKGTFIDVYVPAALYADRETNTSQQHNFLGRSSENKLILFPDNKIFYLVSANSGLIILDLNKEIAFTINPIFYYYSAPTILLPDGKVYIFGYDRSEIYDSKLNKFYLITNMIYERDFRTAVSLPNNKILITGGLEFDPINKFTDAEIYDPKLNKYTAISNMYVKRAAHTATLLNNGKVLIVGGNEKNEPYAELYNLKTGKFIPLNNKNKTRYRHTATLLSDGRVLIVGGTDKYIFDRIYSDIEIFDPKSNKFKEIGHLIYPNSEHSSILLKSNKVFITGGKECNKVNSYVCDAQLFDLKTNKTSLVPNASLWQASALMLEDGSILIVSNSYLAVKNKIRLYIP